MKHKISLSHKKMTKKMPTFGDIVIEINKFYHHKTPICFRDVDIEKVLISYKISFGEKTISTLLIVYLHNNNKVKPLHIKLPKTSANVKDYDR